MATLSVKDNTKWQWHTIICHNFVLHSGLSIFVVVSNQDINESLDYAKKITKMENFENKISTMPD